MLLPFYHIINLFVESRQFIFNLSLPLCLKYSYYLVPCIYFFAKTVQIKGEVMFTHNLAITNKKKRKKNSRKSFNNKNN